MHTFCLFRKKSLLWRNHLCRMKIDSGLDGTSLDGTHFLKYGAKFLLVLHGNSVTEYFCDTVSSKSANPKLIISCSCFPRLGSLISNPELDKVGHSIRVAPSRDWHSFFFSEKVCLVVTQSPKKSCFTNVYKRLKQCLKMFIITIKVPKILHRC